MITDVRTCAHVHSRLKTSPAPPRDSACLKAYSDWLKGQDKRQNREVTSVAQSTPNLPRGPPDVKL